MPFIPRVCKEDAVIVDGDREVHVRAGDHMYPSIKNSGQDQSVYPNPEEIDITRDRSNTKFRGFGYGMHECLGARICHYTLVAQVREVFKLKNVRRAPGPAGKLQRIMQELAETECPVYITAQGEWLAATRLTCQARAEVGCALVLQARCLPCPSRWRLSTTAISDEERG